jgi:hypothetical protein
MVNDHTTYPRVAGNPAFSGISIKAPQTPQKDVVISAYINHNRLLFMTNTLDKYYFFHKYISNKILKHFIPEEINYKDIISKNNQYICF